MHQKVTFIIKAKSFKLRNHLNLYLVFINALALKSDIARFSISSHLSFEVRLIAASGPVKQTHSLIFVQFTFYYSTVPLTCVCTPSSQLYYELLETETQKHVGWATHFLQRTQFHIAVSLRDITLKFWVLPHNLLS